MNTKSPVTIATDNQPDEQKADLWEEELNAAADPSDASPEPPAAEVAADDQGDQSPSSAPSDTGEQAALREIHDAECAVSLAEAEWNAAKEFAKEKKSIYEGAISALRRKVREQTEVLPLFDRHVLRDSEADNGSELAPADQPQAEPGGDTSSNEPLTDDALVELCEREIGDFDCFTDGEVNALINYGIVAIHDLVNSICADTLRYVNGLGPKKVERIQSKVEGLLNQSTGAAWQRIETLV